MVFLLLICVSWFSGWLPWHWMTTGKCCQGSGPIHPSSPWQPVREKAVRRREKDYSSILFFFLCWTSPSLSLLLQLSLSFQKSYDHILSLSRFELPGFSPNSPATIIHSLSTHPDSPLLNALLRISISIPLVPIRLALNCETANMSLKLHIVVRTI